MGVSTPQNVSAVISKGAGSVFDNLRDRAPSQSSPTSNGHNRKHSAEWPGECPLGKTSSVRRPPKDEHALPGAATASESADPSKGCTTLPSTVACGLSPFEVTYAGGFSKVSRAGFRGAKMCRVLKLSTCTTDRLLPPGRRSSFVEDPVPAPYPDIMLQG